MSDLTNAEKRRLEKLFEMNSGYVLGFSNRTFDEFVHDSTGKDIYSEEYAYGSGSKANRMRAFWDKEPNHVVGKLAIDLLDYMEENGSSTDADFLKVRAIATRLVSGAPVPEIDAISPTSSERGFDALAKAVREAIEKNEPETGLDRLHTFVVKFLRVLCERRGIPTDRDEPLHSLLGKYVKHLKAANEIESNMTERILKSNISILEEFNRVRNTQSLAHDNVVLGYEESLLIFNHVAGLVRFINAIEKRRGEIRIDAIEPDELLEVDQPLPTPDELDWGEDALEYAALEREVESRRHELKLIFDDEEVELHLRSEFSEYFS